MIAREGRAGVGRLLWVGCWARLGEKARGSHLSLVKMGSRYPWSAFRGRRGGFDVVGNLNPYVSCHSGVERPTVPPHVVEQF